MDRLRQDLRYAIRSLLRRPLFTVVAAASLAIGIGATTALFSVVNVFALRPVPGVDGWDRAVELGRGNRGRGFDTFTYPEILDIREQVGALEEVAGVRAGSFSFGTGEGGVRLLGPFVSANYFDALGVRPALGRFFDPSVDRGLGRHPVVVVSDHFWRTWMDGSPDALGRTIRVNREALTVIGVTPPGFGGHVVGIRNDLFVPLTMAAALNEMDEDAFADRLASWVQAVGRLTPGATVDEADAQVGALFQRLREARPETTRDRTARVVALGPVPGGGRAPLLGFLGALLALVGMVLLVTCANVAGMFLARAAAREREIAIRLALGSGRTRLVGQLLTESMLVFLLGGAGGVLVAWWAMGLVDLGALPVPIEISLDLRPDGGVLVAGLLVTLVTGVLFGLAPALQTARADLLPALKDDARGGGGRTSRLRRAFATAQVGLSLVLLVAAGLFLRSLQEAANVATGFEPEGVYTTSLDLELDGYGPGGGEGGGTAAGAALQARLLDRLSALPGVEAVGLGIALPLDMASHGTGIRPEGWPEDQVLGIEFNHVSPDWFAALDIRLLQGRVFDDGDRADGEPVAVVSRMLAERVWPGQDPLGKRFRYLLSDEDAGPVTVVGVVEDTKNQTLMQAAEPFVYRPLTQAYRPDLTLAVEATGAQDDVAAAVRAAILEVDPGLSLTPVLSVERLTSIGVLPQRIAAGLAGSLGLVALFLSGLGVYGVVAFMVGQRTREIGIRMALGAGGRRVLAEVLQDGMALALPGLAVGGVVAVLLARLLASQNVLLGVGAADPVALGGVAVLLLAVVFGATVVPARRASRVPPSEALRGD